MTNQNTAVLLGEDGDIEKLRALSDAAPAGPWDALTPEIVGCPSGEKANIAYAPGIASFIAGAANYVRAALARTNNTDLALEIFRLRCQAARLESKYGLTGAAKNIRDAADKLESALASASTGSPSDDLPTLLDNLMRAAFDDGDRGREKFSGATMAARDAVLAHVRGASAPPSAPVGVEALVAKLRAVLCDPAGNVCIEGSDADRAEVQGALDALESLAQQPAAPEGCGACGDGCANRSGGCRLAEENPPAQPAAPSGEAVAQHAETPEEEGRRLAQNECIGLSDLYGTVSYENLEGERFARLVAAFRDERWGGGTAITAQQPAAVDRDEVRRVAQHIGTAADYIDKSYPDAKMLDRGPILRNMRRWHERLIAAITAKQQGGA